MAEPRRERKVVTVLFADLVGFTAARSSSIRRTSTPCFGPTTSVCARSSSSWAERSRSSSATRWSRSSAHRSREEDDPERALRAALAIRDWATDEDGVEVRIAVNTGEALVSLDARPDSGEGFVAGDVVNTAARLQSAAPVNGILVGEQTQRATSHVIDYASANRSSRRERASRSRSGKRCRRARASASTCASTEVPLVGRDSELEHARGCSLACAARARAATRDARRRSGHRQEPARVGAVRRGRPWRHARRTGGRDARCPTGRASASGRWQRW